MIQHRFSRCLIALLLLATAAAPLAAQGGAEKCSIQITEPLAKQEISTTVSVKGTATFSPGNHLWTFIRPVRKYRSEERWYPQEEGFFTDSEARAWEANASLAPGHNIGDLFDVTAAVVSQVQHAALLQHMSEGQANNWEPMRMPTVVCVATVLTVRKTKD